jgi:sortase A
VWAALAAIVIAASWSSGLWAENSLPDPGWAVNATTPTTNLIDAQPVTVNIKSNSDVAVNQAEIRQCRFGPDYRTSEDLRPEAGNCPTKPVSSSATLVVIRSASSGLTTLARTDAGANLSFRVGSGQADWQSEGGPTSLVCDPSHPCALVVGLVVGSTFHAFVVKLSFTETDPIAACGGPAAGVVSSAASDELSDAWSTWTRDFCATHEGGAPSRMAFTGEGDAVTSFAKGDIDLAYTASGYDGEAGLVDADVTARRNAIAVPVALNAAVIGVGGGYHPIVNGAPSFDKSPYPQLLVSRAEAGAMIGGGLDLFARLDGKYIQSITARNPILNSVVYSRDAPGILASSQTMSSSFFVTDFLSRYAPDDFIAQRLIPPVPRAPAANLARAQPPFEDLSLFTGRPALGRYTINAPFSLDDGPMWVLTDRATATALGLNAAAIENAAGAFVAPTPSTMNAAIATMRQGANGMLLPDIAGQAQAGSSGITAGGAQGEVRASADVPYPLTYIEYMLVPAEPLIEPATCAPRADAQSLLTKWIDYVLGTGQGNLPAGLEPLPAELLSQAKVAAAKVGTAAVTGPCAGSVSASGGAGGVGAPGLPSGPGVNAATIPGAAAARGTSGLGTADLSQSAAGSPESSEELRLAVPAFAGRRLPATTDGVLALVGIALVLSLAVFITSRQATPARGSVATGEAGAVTPSAQRRTLALVALWASVTAVGVGLVVYQLGPVLQQRDQRGLLASFRLTLRQGAYASEGLSAGTSNVESPPDEGSPVAVLEIGAVRLQQVVVEGASSSQTVRGPGHVAGTAGLGQPGNSVVVGRRNSFGGPFGELASLARGDKIVATTKQGNSVYKVASVRDVTIADSDGAEKGDTVQRTKLFGPTDDDRLTLTTSASRAPWNNDRATVVVAKMVGMPFEPTVQGGRTSDEVSLGADGGAWPTVVLALLAYAGVIAASVLVYRRLRFGVAYIMTIAPLAVVTIIFAESVVRVLPSWS